jgi:quinol monooxygenase YgiN
MSVLVNLQLKVKQDQVPAVLDMFPELLPGTRAYEGCHWVKLMKNLEHDNVLEAVSQWDSKEHYDAYLKWRVDTGAVSALTEFLDAEPVFRFLPVELEY